MAPDRGAQSAMLSSDPTASPRHHHHRRDRELAADRLADRASQPSNFTIRGLLLGLLIGIVVVFSNTYFGLQTGWISGMAMPAALISFALFRTLEPLLKLPFSPQENVFIQSVSGSVGTMPLGCGFVGVIPALEYLLSKDENGPLNISTGRLVLWALGICLFGVVFAVPLRREVIIREKLKFPSGTATALMISVLHGEKGEAKVITQRDEGDESRQESLDDEEITPARHSTEHIASQLHSGSDSPASHEADWKAKIRLLFIAFCVSAVYTVLTYFVPGLRNIPILGLTLAQEWLWTLNPSPAYVGQGIIMGPWTTAYMLLGAIIGWGVLSPLAKYRGWAPGPVSDWSTGSKGWIVWVSLAIMLADALVSLGWLVGRLLVRYGQTHGPLIWTKARQRDWRGVGTALFASPSSTQGYSRVVTEEPGDETRPLAKPNGPDEDDDEPEADAPQSQLISTRTFVISVAVSVALYFIGVHVSFPNLMHVGLTLLALILALFLSVLGVRALGETDLNPVSGISKLTQLFFALVVPLKGNSNAVTINLLAGAISESAALQAGDLLQDLKAGHLLGASPSAQFWGQLCGSVVGAAASAFVYKLYAKVYTIPSNEFQVPTGFVWIFTARLVTGKGLPAKATEFALAFGAVWMILTLIRSAFRGRKWVNYAPGGIAVAVGMYNTPSFTLARAFGGLLVWYWTKYRGRDGTTVIILASGLILGEGLFSIVNLGLASADVPHLADWGV